MERERIGDSVQLGPNITVAAHDRLSVAFGGFVPEAGRISDDPTAQWRPFRSARHPPNRRDQLTVRRTRSIQAIERALSLRAFRDDIRDDIGSGSGR
jgi:hypothetical protein